MHRTRRFRLPLAAALLLTVTGCPPAEEQWLVDVRLTHRGAPLAGAWVVWLPGTRGMTTDESGAMQLKVDDDTELPYLVMHPTAGAQRIDADIEHGGPLPQNRFAIHFTATMELDGFDGLDLRCDGLACSVDVPPERGGRCRGQFVFVGIDGDQPMYQRAEADDAGRRLTGTQPGDSGAAAFVGRCYGGVGDGAVFASGRYAPAPIPTGEEAAVDLAPALADDAPVDVIVTAASDPRVGVSTPVINQLVARLDGRHGPAVRPEQRDLDRPDAPTSVRAAGQLLGAQIAAAEPGAALADAHAMLAGAFLSETAVGDAASLRSVSCTTHHCTIADDCTGRLAYYVEPVEDEQRQLIVTPERSASIPPVRSFRVGVVFAGRCGEHDRVDLAWTKVAAASGRWALWMRDLDTPAQRAWAARLLVDLVTRRSPGPWPSYGLDAPLRAAGVTAPLARAAAAGDGVGRAGVLAALDRLAERLLAESEMTEGARKQFARASSPALPIALRAAEAEPDAAPIHLLALQAAGHGSAADALVAVLAPTIASGDAQRVAALVANLPEAATVPKDLSATLRHALSLCGTVECREPIYVVLGQHPDPETARVVMARFADDGPATLPALVDQVPTDALVGAALAQAFGPGGRYRVEAATLLRAWRPGADEVIVSALGALGDAKTRLAAVRVLTGQHSSPKAVAALRSIANDGYPDDETRREIIWTLRRIDTPAAVEALSGLVYSLESEHERLVAMLAMVETRSAPDAVRVTLRDRMHNADSQRMRHLARGYLRSLERRLAPLP